MRKDNVEMKNFILENLTEVEFTHTYALAIRENKMVKACIVENADEIMPYITRCEQQAKSHNAVWGVRMNGTRADFELIKSYAREIITLCSVAEFENIYATEGNRGSNNRGHIFEKLCANRMGGKQVESMTAKCTESGDIIVKGEHIQCKLWNATVTTEPQVLRFINQQVKIHLLFY